MKKITIIVIVISLMAFSLSVSAFADDDEDLQDKVPFYYVTDGNSNNVTDEAADGFVVIVTPHGKPALIVQGSIKGLEPKTEYYVWIRDIAGYTGESLLMIPGSGYYKLEMIKTNKKGNVNFHIKIERGVLPAGIFMLQVAINLQTTDEIGQTVIATDWPGIAVVVAN